MSKIPAVPRPEREPLSVKEQVYVSLLRHWYKHRPRTPPTMMDLVGLCRPRRSLTAIRAALLSAESKGHVKRNNAGRFEVMP